MLCLLGVCNKLCRWGCASSTRSTAPISATNSCSAVHGVAPPSPSARFELWSEAVAVRYDADGVPKQAQRRRAAHARPALIDPPQCAAPGIRLPSRPRPPHCPHWSTSACTARYGTPIALFRSQAPVARLASHSLASTLSMASALAQRRRCDCAGFIH